MVTDPIGDLIEAQDLNALLRVIDGHCSAGRWEDLLDLAERCEDAVERGKQLWPIAAHVDYRLALEAPGEYAAEALESPLARFHPGPLSEVVASTHTWGEVADLISTPHHAAFVAQERVLRGDDLEGDPRAHPEVLGLPLRLMEWEPTYALARYRSNHVEVPEVWSPRAPLLDVEPEDGESLDEPELETALLELVQPWTAESNGAAQAAVVEGTARAAASALGFGPLRMGNLEPAEALQRMAWAAAAGGAHGRRRGAALGRSLAWHTVALLGDLPWPSSVEGLRRRLIELRWFYWDEGAPEEGWVLRLAVEDPTDGWAAAIAATDLASE